MDFFIYQLGADVFFGWTYRSVFLDEIDANTDCNGYQNNNTNSCNQQLQCTLEATEIEKDESKNVEKKKQIDKLKKMTFHSY